MSLVVMSSVDDEATVVLVLIAPALAPWGEKVVSVEERAARRLRLIEESDEGG